ncbi:hypothetical protein HaLaN_32282 [Haematococcus lacustris]|uniref:Uncharacterized protein n=1 Tax=Haematococcus lacustris TaxID=44745 RepID=A0A6A0AJK4_HAELA|nr:hypothetical protein HaLaN_32282 [Haematococcus lacustris]
MLGPQLRMRPLPSLEKPSSLTLTPPPLDWEAAAGNLEDSKLAVQAIKDLVSDAVFLGWCTAQLCASHGLAGLHQGLSVSNHG